MSTNDNKNEVVVDKVWRGSIAKLVNEGIMEMVYDDELNRYYRLTKKGVEYVIKREKEKGSNKTMKYIVVFQVEHNASFPEQAMINIETAIAHVCEKNDSKIRYYRADEIKESD